MSVRPRVIASGHQRIRDRRIGYLSVKATTMQHRQICDRSVFDGSFDDPRTLVYFYQQKMRGQLLAKAAAEANRRSAWSVCLSQIGDALRWLAAPRADQRTAMPLAARRSAMPLVV
jgi:hypothetical protein